MDILFTDLDNTLIYSKKTDIKKRDKWEVYVRRRYVRF